MSAPATFEDRVAKARPDLFRFAMSITRNREAADDLSQDAMTLALEKQDDFEPGTDLKAWLFKLQVNLWQNSVRKEHRRRRLDAIHAPMQAGDLSLPSQMDALMFHEAYKAMESLEPIQRQVLFLITYDGKSYEEAARILEINTGTVKSRLSRARQALADAIGYEPGRKADSSEMVYGR